MQLQRQSYLHIGVPWVFCAVVTPKRIARVHDVGLAVEGEHGVWPVEIGSHDKLELMTAPQVDDSAAFHGLSLEVLAHEILQEVDGYLQASQQSHPSVSPFFWSEKNGARHIHIRSPKRLRTSTVYLHCGNEPTKA
jgi:hypothetical protein